MRPIQQNIIYSFEERRLAKILRQASLAYIKREYGRTQRFLDEAIDLMDWACREEWSYAQEFIAHWQETVKTEQGGKLLSTAPAAWIHLGQELASLLETGGDWIGYLKQRWQMEDSSLPWKKRATFATLGTLALFLGALVLGMTAKAIYLGELSLTTNLWQMSGQELATLALGLARVAGAALMLEHGYYWSRRALEGKDEAPGIVFLPSQEGLTLLQDQQT